jgi:hypothetical protein
MANQTRQSPSSVRPTAALALGAVLVLAGCGAGEPQNGATSEPGAATGEATALAGAAPRATIVEPSEGVELDGESVTVVLAAENIVLAPTGDERPGTGHLHLFVNQPVTAAGVGIPAGPEGIIHLGQAQTSYELTGLAPGEYTIVAVLGDLVHRTIDPQAMDTVRFRVRARN